MRPWLYMLGFVPASILVDSLASYCNIPGDYIAQVPALLSLSLFAYDAWSRLGSFKRAPSPGSAFFLLIPVFNLYWLFRTISPIGTAVAEVSQLRNVSGSTNSSLSSLYCHLQIASGITLVAAFMAWGFSGERVMPFPFKCLAVIGFALLAGAVAAAYAMFYTYSRQLDRLSANKES